jgi:hypothetical protein
MGCEREIFIEDEFSNRLPVINGFWDADGQIKIWVSESGQILSKPQLNQYIENFGFSLGVDSFVMLSGNTRLDSGIFNYNLSPIRETHFFADFQVNDLMIVNIEGKFPQSQPELKIDTIINKLTDYTIKAELVNQPEEEFFLMDLKIIIAKQGDTIIKPYTFSTKERLFQTNLNSLRTDVNYVLFNDYLIQDTVFSFGLNITGNTDKIIGVVMTITSLTKDYYQYLIDVSQYSGYLSGPLSNNFNITGNVKGGLGYLAGIRQKEVVYYIP